MHGRLKVRTSEEQAEAKRREQQEKLKIYLGVTSKIFAKREAGEYDEEALELTRRILEKNPDFYTLWNFRREILLSLKGQKNEDELKRLSLIELDLTQHCLRVNLKSYSAWHHRFWANEFIPEADWKRELKLCSYFLAQDDRNFHAWDYRRRILKKCNVSPEDELAYSTELIETNFSNYSAWHYRSKLLPIVHADPVKGTLKEEILIKEFDLIQNAAFTDPDDQSVWFYHRWLLGRSKEPVEILNVSFLKAQNAMVVLFSEPVEVDDKCLQLEINKVPVFVYWRPVDSSSPASTVWCGSPALEIEQFCGADQEYMVSVYLLKDKDMCSLSCDFSGTKCFVWKKTTRANTFRSDFSAAAKGVLERELESCQQLNELEPNCKWTMFTCVLLMRALNNTKFQKEIENFMAKLTAVDSLRKNYYKDLGSKFVIEDAIEILPVESTYVDLSNKHLTSLCHFDQLILIEKIDLSSNHLTSVYPLRYLISINSINLDDNQIDNLEGIEELKQLEVLSVKRNLIKEISNLELLKTCIKLQELCLKGNSVVNNTQYIPTIQMIPTLKLIDGSTL